MNNFFSPEEFLCNCGREDCDAQITPSRDLVTKLNAMREHVNRPIIINSGIRCPRYNAEVGGVSSSEHITGEGADLRIAGSRERYELVNAALSVGFNRIGVAKTFVHVGVSKTLDSKVLWLY